MSDAGGTLSYIAPVFRAENLYRSLAFYRDQLGFDLDFCYEEFYASVSRDGCHIHLRCAGPTSRDEAAFEREQFIDASIGVQDIDALWTAFNSASVTFAVPLRQMPYGVEFYVRDPDGNVLAFVQPASE